MEAGGHPDQGRRSVARLISIRTELFLSLFVSLLLGLIITPLGSVDIGLQFLGALLCGAYLRRRSAMLGQVAYIILWLIWRIAVGHSPWPSIAFVLPLPLAAGISHAAVHEANRRFPPLAAWLALIFVLYGTVYLLNPSDPMFWPLAIAAAIMTLLLLAGRKQNRTVTSRLLWVTIPFFVLGTLCLLADTSSLFISLRDAVVYRLPVHALEILIATKILSLVKPVELTGIRRNG